MSITRKGESETNMKVTESINNSNQFCHKRFKHIIIKMSYDIYMRLNRNHMVHFFKVDFHNYLVKQKVQTSHIRDNKLIIYYTNLFIKKKKKRNKKSIFFLGIPVSFVINLAFLFM